MLGLDGPSTTLHSAVEWVLSRDVETRGVPSYAC